jgi:type III restriction enzyme
MTLRYTSDLAHQQKAIEAVLSLFEGQPKQEDNFSIFEDEAVVDNRLLIDDKTVLANLQKVQSSNGLDVSQKLESLDFSIEMETGTGKTYVYLRTVLELYIRYGWKKFVIVVPSIAIKEGVLASLEGMGEHFVEELKTRYNHFEYSSDRLTELKHFIRDDELQIMVTTLDGFKRQNTVMQRDDLENFSASPLESLARTRPIAILDEPQNMESDLSKEALGALSPLFVLRYSATHKNLYNLIYSLSPKDALDAGLVKKVFVVGISEQKVASEAYISVVAIDRDKNKKLFATLELIANQKSSFVKKEFNIKVGDELAEKTKNRIYDGFAVSEINFAQGFVTFENGITLSLHETSGQVKKEIQKEQIKQAVKKHFETTKRLKSKGIKPLCLFFVDRVANFLESEGGWIEPYFCEVFDEMKPEYEEFADKSVTSAYKYYFAKRPKGYIDELKNNDADRKASKEAYDLILKGKEQLMKADEPVSFIFSHSALKEGWDNPNVFTIATLNETNSDLKRRQILGRGLRLCVDKDGDRINDTQINRLSVVANESFASFSENLQKEYEATGQTCGGVSDDKTKQKAVLKKDVLLSDEFKKLWAKIGQKTEYRIELKTENFISDVSAKLDEMEFCRLKIKIEEGAVGEGVDEERQKNVHFTPHFPDIVTELAVSTGLTRQTVISILEKIDLYKFLDDFDSFVKKASLIINDEKAMHLANGITYTKLDEWWQQENIFEDEFEDFDLTDMRRSLYDKIKCDSITEEKFAKCADGRFGLTIKLPKRFYIKTPLGKYSPDWAIVANDESKSCFVVETKAAELDSELRGVEGGKIKCGEKHFEKLDVPYKKKKNCEDIALS